MHNQHVIFISAATLANHRDPLNVQDFDREVREIVLKYGDPEDDNAKLINHDDFQKYLSDATKAGTTVALFRLREPEFIDVPLPPTSPSSPDVRINVV